MKVPCITVRDQTEWVETLQFDANILTGTDKEKILDAVAKESTPEYLNVFGDGHAAEKIFNIINK